MAPKAKGKNKGADVEVEFPASKTFPELFGELLPHQTAFSVTFNARCHPSMLEKTRIGFTWLDADFQGVNTPADGVPPNLGAWERNERASSSSEVQVSFTKQFPAQPVTLELLSLLRTAVMEATIFTKDLESGKCRISLSPLLLATEGAEAGNESPSGTKLPISFPSKVWSTRRDQLKAPGLFSLEMCVGTEQPLLTEEMAKLLLPVFVEVKAVKNMPNEPWLPDKAQGVYAQVYAQLSATTKPLAPDLQLDSGQPPTVPGATEDAAVAGSKEKAPKGGKSGGSNSGSSTAKKKDPSEIGKVRAPLDPDCYAKHAPRIPLDAKVVLFLGIFQENLHLMREWLMSDSLLIEVHDRDTADAPADDPASGASAEEGISAGVSGSEQEEAQKKKVSPKVNPHGLARFRLADFLLTSSWDMTLRADLYPIRSNVKQRYKELKAEGLDPATLLDRETRSKVARLASTAELREFEPPYLEHGTFVQCRFVKRATLPSWLDLQKEAEVYRAEKFLNPSEKRVVDPLDAPEDWRCYVWKAVDPKNGSVHYRFKMLEPEEVFDPENPCACGPYRLKQREAERDALLWMKTNLVTEEERASTQAPPSEEDYSALEEELKEIADREKAEEWLTTNKNSLVPPSSTGIDLKHERYGRLVYVLDIQNEKTATEVLRIVREVNQKAVGLENAHISVLKNYELSDAEKLNPELDVLTGFCLLDKKCRIFVVEGLRKGGIARLLREIPRMEPNDEKNRLIGNNDVGFSDTLYQRFNLSLKHVKIRQNLEVLTGTKPELYDVTRCAPEIFTIVEQLRELKRASRIQHAKDYLKCFPTVECLTKLEILYGDYISDEELAGGISPEFAKKLLQLELERREEEAEEAAAAGGAHSSAPAHSMAGDTTHPDSMDQANNMITGLNRTRAVRKSQLDMQNTAFEIAEDLRRSQSVPNMVRRNMTKVAEQSADNTRFKSMSKVTLDTQTFLDPDAEVFIYSGQKLQSSELQKQYMRQQMWPLQEKFMWTYSPIYNSSAFEFDELATGRPGNVAMREDKPIAGKVPFQYPKAAEGETFKKPLRDVTDYRRWELETFPWAENEWHGLAVGAERRKPINAKKIFDAERVPHLREHNDRPFDPNLIERRIKEFGPKSMWQSVHEAGDTYENAIIEINKKEKEEREKGRIGPDVWGFYDKDKTKNGLSTMDKYESIRHGDPVRMRGIKFDQKFIPKAIKKKYGKHKILERTIKQLPTSMRIEENWDETAPQVEFEARMRNNDVMAPYNVKTNLYVSRHTDQDLPGFNPTLYTKRSFHVGNMAPAPWKHSSGTFEKQKTQSLKQISSAIRGIDYDYEQKYVSNRDFDRYSAPARNYAREDFLEKNATRLPMLNEDKGRHAEKFEYSQSMRKINYSGTMYDSPNGRREQAAR
ncbi:unnamed protein product [Amoebophrya sp. A25]|nr:unnamed protein product [Amoebophrya sp. A25]|eukprot:GSA25T00010911001.1